MATITKVIPDNSLITIPQSVIGYLGVRSVILVSELNHLHRDLCRETISKIIHQFSIFLEVSLSKELFFKGRIDLWFLLEKFQDAVQEAESPRFTGKTKLEQFFRGFRSFSNEDAVKLQALFQRHVWYKTLVLDLFDLSSIHRRIDQLYQHVVGKERIRLCYEIVKTLLDRGDSLKALKVARVGCPLNGSRSPALQWRASRSFRDIFQALVNVDALDEVGGVVRSTPSPSERADMFHSLICTHLKRGAVDAAKSCLQQMQADCAEGDILPIMDVNFEQLCQSTGQQFVRPLALHSLVNRVPVHL